MSAAPSNITGTNVVLVGMPGAGKSTVGVILAKQLSLSFVDTDVLIQTREGRSLQDIVNTEGYMALRRIEEDLILSLELDRHVISTGGSAVYSRKAMRHLARNGVIVFLDVDLPALRRRIVDYTTRGLAKRPEQTFEDLFAERRRLYLEAADLTLECGHMPQEAVSRELGRRLAPEKGSPV